MTNLHINSEFLTGATQMELSGLQETKVKSVEVFIVNERTARIRLHWEHWPLKDVSSFSVTDQNTLDGLRCIIATELRDIETAIKVMPSSGLSDPTIN